MSYISSSFFHYTNSLKNIKGILSGGFGVFYCKEEIYSDKGSGKIDHIRIPMCSFCDIPLGYISSSTYGNYIIGMSHSWGYNKELLPVLYYPNNKKVLSTKMIIAATTAFKSNPKDTDKFLILGFAKPMKKIAPSAKSKYPRDNYREREWRKVYSPTSKYKWMNEEEYAASNGKNAASKNKKPIGNPLCFKVEDVDMIIVPQQEVKKLISYISSPAVKIGGETGKITKSQRRLLISKIIAFESLSKNI